MYHECEERYKKVYFLFWRSFFCFFGTRNKGKSGTRQRARDLESVKKDGSRKESEAILKSKR